MKLHKSLAVLLLLAVAPSCNAIWCLINPETDFAEEWPNGTKKKEGKLDCDGLQTGEWTRYYDNGFMLSKGAYLDDREYGSWTYWDENGNVQREERWDEVGHRTGSWTYYHPNGSRRANGSYLNDLYEGEWSFWDPQDTLVKHGGYSRGQMSNRWTFWYPSGERKEEGLYLLGRKVGDWVSWTEDGAVSRPSYVVPEGYELVQERWPNGRIRREGVRHEGSRSGRWVSYHENGALRMDCTLRDDKPEGRFSAHRSDGKLLVEGVIRDDGLLIDGLATAIDGPLPAPPPMAGEWSPASIVDNQPTRMVIAMWLDELTSPLTEVQVINSDMPGAVPSPPDDDEEPTRIAPIFGGWSELDEKRAKDVEVYGEGRQRNSRPLTPDYPGGISFGRIGQGSQREELLGQRLDIGPLKGVDGELVNIDDFLGTKNVLLVVLRGFSGQVCCYCVAQTRALSDSEARFDDLDLEVLVVFPGEKGDEEAFLQAYESTFGDGEFPPYQLFYDPGLELTDQLGIGGGNKAYPTSILIDKSGKVRYAYTGMDRSDRPTVRELRRILETM